MFKLFRRKTFVFFYADDETPFTVKAYSMEAARIKLRAFVTSAISHNIKLKLTTAADPGLLERELSKFKCYEVAK